MPGTKTRGPIYQIKVSLRNVRPPVWRRLVVPGDITLDDLHEVIQGAMGWQNYHMHHFEVGGEYFGEPDPEDDFDVTDETKTKLKKVAPAEKSRVTYLYDFGDGWEHEILVEKVLSPEPDATYPRCIKGKRACPPEDCGGPWGYANMLEALSDSTHSEHEQFVEWIGDEFDPEAFSLSEVNQRLHVTA